MDNHHLILRLEGQLHHAPIVPLQAQQTGCRRLELLGPQGPVRPIPVHLQEEFILHQGVHRPIPVQIHLVQGCPGLGQREVRPVRQSDLIGVGVAHSFRRFCIVPRLVDDYT